VDGSIGRISAHPFQFRTRPIVLAFVVVPHKDAADQNARFRECSEEYSLFIPFLDACVPIFLFAEADSHRDIFGQTPIA
jgi:hypothetical protein